VREALSLGVPVVGYDHGGVGETLRLAYPAGRVPPGDLDALETVTRELLEHPVEVAPQAFASVQDMVDSTIALYQDLVRA
jgi:glycosyltransferase involved in cell wall biosynthesis